MNRDCWCFERKVLEFCYFCLLILMKNTYLKNSSSSLLMMNLLAFFSVIAIVSTFGFLFGCQSWFGHSRLRGWSQLCSWLSGGLHRASVCTSNSTWNKIHIYNPLAWWKNYCITPLCLSFSIIWHFKGKCWSIVQVWFLYLPTFKIFLIKSKCIELLRVWYLLLAFFIPFSD